MTASAAPTAPRTAYAGILLLAASIILFEISLTRIFAVMMWHHFTYMVVSIALLGFGAAGSLLTARGSGLNTADPAGPIAKATLGYGFAAMAALCMVTTVNVDTLHLWDDPKNLFALLLIYLLITGPLLLGGLAIGLALTRYGNQVNRLYFADLIGSALGGGLSVALLDRIGGPATIMLAGALGVFAAFVLALGAPRRLALRTLPFVALAAFIAIAFAGGSPALGIPAARWDVPFALGKEVNDSGVIVARIPSATAEVEVSMPYQDAEPVMGGNFGVVDAARIELRAVGQDGTAPTALYRNAGRIDDFPFLDDTQAASAYVAFAARGGVAPDVLVIGVGGGVDVMVALAHGAGQVDAAEINTAMIEMVTERYDAYLGGLFRPGAHKYSDRIRLVNSEGRSFMRHGDAKYDVIQMSGVDSFTALSSGAYTLSESFLYTVEAVQEFYAHLKDGGYVNYSRFIMVPPRKPRETLRLANIALTALEELGIEDPASHVAVFQGQNWASTMVKKGPFTRAEIDALDRFAEIEQFRGLVFDPLRDLHGAEPIPGHLPALARARFVEVLERQGLMNDALLAAMTDAFASGLRKDDAGMTVALERAAGHLGAEREAREDGLRRVVTEAVASGAPDHAKFQETRRIFEGLLRGSKAERAAFMAAYPYDVTPSTDDSPFFFNYYKYSGLLETAESRGTVDAADFQFHPEYPVGHMVLLSSLAQIGMLAFVLLLLPLRFLQRRGVASPGKARYLAFFGALGVGFMFVEIVLMQKVVIFLGHPTYSLSVVLTALLGFAGIGSFLAGRIDFARRANLVRLCVAIAALIALTAAAVNVVPPPLLLGQAFPVRVAAVLAMLLPVGIALGMPFPTGLRLVREKCPQLLPWAWAINGFASVFSSVLCIVISMATGFTTVLLIAAAIYVAGFSALLIGRK